MNPEAAVLLNYDPQEWGPALQAPDPALRIRVMPDLQDVEDIDCLITHKVQPELIDRLPNLKLVYGMGAGVDYLLDIVRARPGLKLARIADDAMSGDVAALAVGGVLQWFRDLPTYGELQAQGVWRKLRNRTTADTTVGVLGLGRIGGAVARSLQALGFQVCGWSRGPKELEGVSVFHGDEGLQRMLPRAQVVVCTLPLTPQTEGILGADALARLPRGAFVVNVGRGGHVDEAALLVALDSGHLAGAFLDVFAHEPLPAEHRLWRHPAVRLTPHVGSRTIAARAAPQIVDNIKRMRSGAPLLNLVDPGAGY